MVNQCYFVGPDEADFKHFIDFHFDDSSKNTLSRKIWVIKLCYTFNKDIIMDICQPNVHIFNQNVFDSRELRKVSPRFLHTVMSVWYQIPAT